MFNKIKVICVKCKMIFWTQFNLDAVCCRSICRGNLKEHMNKSSDYDWKRELDTSTI